MSEIITNKVTVSCNYGVNVSECEVSTVINRGSLKVVKSSGPQIIGLDESICFTINVCSYGEDREFVVVSDTLANNLIFNNDAFIRTNSDNTQTSIIPTINGKVLTFNIGHIDADSIKTIVFTAKPSSNLVPSNTSTIINQAIVKYINSPDGGVPSNKTENYYSYVDLNVYKIAPQYLLCGEYMSYTLLIINTGNLAANSITLEDILPSDDNSSFTINKPYINNIFVNGNTISSTDFNIDENTNKLTITNISVLGKIDNQLGKTEIVLKGKTQCK